MRARACFVACLVIAGCTRANLSYLGGNGGNGGSGGAGGGAGGGGGGGNGGPDLSSPPGAHDMSGGVDLFGAAGDMMMVCAPGARRCVDLPTPTSEQCNGSGTDYRVDRRCPFGNATMMGAACTSGYCQPPTTNGTTSCDGGGGPLEDVCSGPGNMGKEFSCEPFITDPATKTVRWWCAVAAVASTTGGGAGASCTSGAQCHSGFCGSNGTCFWACQSTGNCPQAGGGNTMPCTSVTLRVEGVNVTAKSCTP
jgi:hypothetical protein